MNIALNIIQILVSLLLVLTILLQTKGGGLGTAFGQSQEMFRTKRGMEKILHFSTITLAVIFLITSLVSVLLK